MTSQDMAIRRGVANFCCRNLAPALDRRGLIRAHFGLNVIRDCYGRDDQDHGFDDLEFEDGESRVGAVRVFGHFGRFQLSLDVTSFLVRT